MRTRRRIDSSSIIAHPVSLRYTRDVKWSHYTSLDIPREGSREYYARTRYIAIYVYIYMYIERLTLSIIIDHIDRQHWKSCTAVATSEWHTVKICKHSHNRLIDNIGDYLYFKNQRMEASNLKLIHISSTWDCTTFHNFLPMFQKKKKDFQKLAGLWLADEVVNHVGIYGSKAAEGLSAFQRRSCTTSSCQVDCNYLS